MDKDITPFPDLGVDQRRLEDMRASRLIALRALGESPKIGDRIKVAIPFGFAYWEFGAGPPSKMRAISKERYENPGEFYG